MKPKNYILTCALTILVFSCPSFSQTDSNRPDLSLCEQPLTALAGIDSVWLSFYKSKTPGVPYIPDPCYDREKIQERLKLAGISRVSMPFLNRKPDAPLPAELRIKIYIHNFNITDPYVFYIELAIARPVVIPEVRDSPFYAEVWHSEGTIGTASEQDLQEKINKALVNQLDDLIVGSKTARFYSSKSPATQVPNQPSPKLSK
jgi:hypothetical protein